MKAIIFISLLLAGCGKTTGSNDIKTLSGQWLGSGSKMIITKETPTTGTIDITYDLGAECSYDYLTNSNNDDNASTPSGVMIISNGADVWNSGAITCSGLDGTWDYALLADGELSLCTTIACHWFN
jgi:hypothetical protein